MGLCPSNFCLSLVQLPINKTNTTCVNRSCMLGCPQLPKQYSATINWHCFQSPPQQHKRSYTREAQKKHKEAQDKHKRSSKEAQRSIREAQGSIREAQRSTREAQEKHKEAQGTCWALLTIVLSVYHRQNTAKHKSSLAPTDHHVSVIVTCNLLMGIIRACDCQFCHAPVNLAITVISLPPQTFNCHAIIVITACTDCAVTLWLSLEDSVPRKSLYRLHNENICTIL